MNFNINKTGSVTRLKEAVTKELDAVLQQKQQPGIHGEAPAAEPAAADMLGMVEAAVTRQLDQLSLNGVVGASVALNGNISGNNTSLSIAVHELPNFVG